METESGVLRVFKNLQDPFLLFRVGNIEQRSSTVSGGSKRREEEEEEQGGGGDVEFYVKDVA